ncbi:hypothetical protein Aple_012900 [Acrocarpospora pleiomorpha]|uniref:BD-FAE-like domain-containing protein n=1 Tax=Acrocarpospora pleiomorpha TaxID=90975 RepID=A0A5M3X9I6_9ACTN|nr:alpha/beta hydrolase [Acrocarpospora pleiomorpha]GES18395.1 hypothetical protein Aple_012900 [Acrocarpospora pleiomorpha]
MRGSRRVLVAGTGLAVLPVLWWGFSWYSPWVPDVLGLVDRTSDAAITVAIRGPYLAIPAVFLGALAVWAWRWRCRKTAGAAALAALLALSLAVVPWLAAWRTAAAMGDAVSLLGFFDEPTGGGPTATEVYHRADGQDLKLDVWLPERPAPGRPAVIRIHGGGFTKGDRTESVQWNRWLNEQGIAVFAPDYRLSPPPRWLAQIADVKCAIGWVRSRADDYGIDPGNLSLMGGSAGGSLALVAAYSTGDDRLPTGCDQPDLPVASVIAFFPITDMSAMMRDSRLPSVARSIATDHLGGCAHRFPDRYRLTSPATFVRPGLPPTLLIHGERDHLVPVSQSIDLSHRLTSANVPHQTVLLPWEEHAFSDQWGRWGSQVSRPVVARFLLGQRPTLGKT